MIERREVRGHVGLLEVVRAPLPLGALVHLAVRDARRERDVVDGADVLEVHRDALEAVGELAGHGATVDAADLLEVRELAYFLAVQPYLPAEAPCAERRRLPVVLEETDVVLLGMRTDRDERLEVHVLDLERRRLEDHLELVELLQAVRVVTVASVGRPA